MDRKPPPGPPGDQPDLAASLTTWMSAPNWEESERYFTAHREELRTDEVQAILKEFSGSRLEDAAVHTAIWYLAFTDDISSAFNYVKDETALRARLERALQDANGTTMRDLAWLEVFVHRDLFVGSVHLWVSTKLDYDAQGAPPIESLHPTPEDRNRASADVAMLLRHHPEHATTLAPLIQTILYPTP
jgi:hypothetical protein